MKQDKALYQLNRFINSEKFFELDLNPYHITILFMIARYLDMPQGFCSLKQTQLARECRMSYTEFKRRSDYLCKKNLLLRYFKGKIYRYEYGEVLTGKEVDFE